MFFFQYSLLIFEYAYLSSFKLVTSSRPVLKPVEILFNSHPKLIDLSPGFEPDSQRTLIAAINASIPKNRMILHRSIRQLSLSIPQLPLEFPKLCINELSVNVGEFCICFSKCSYLHQFHLLNIFHSLKLFFKF